MSKILAICGKKTSGKSTLCNFLHGYQLKSYGIIDDFDLTDKGKLIIKSKGENDEIIQGMVDINRRDEEFATWAAYNVWPFVKQYSFARALKEMCVGLFNVPYEAIYGTNEEKEQKIPHLLWENMPGVVTPEKWDEFSGSVLELNRAEQFLGLTEHQAGPMSGREFMQFLGTEIMRRMYSDIWANNTLEEIQSEGSLLSLVDDGRYDNEIQALQALGGKAIQLIRVDSDDQHSSENGFVETKFDAVLDARGLSIREMCEALMVILNGWGWLGEHSE
jgi:energy-coupling factor transporter ATP-binding protein EcfA2